MNKKLFEQLPQQDRIEYLLKKNINEHQDLTYATWFIIVTGFVAVNLMVSINNIPTAIRILSITIGCFVGTTILNWLIQAFLKNKLDKDYEKRFVLKE